VVQHSVQGLSYLLLESSRQNLNETDFLDSIMLLAFPPAINQGLRDVCDAMQCIVLFADPQPVITIIIIMVVRVLTLCC
jgi:hypothetical protein